MWDAAMFLDSTFSIQLRYIIVMYMFSSACDTPLDMRMKRTILLGKMTIKKFFLISPLLKISIFCFLFIFKILYYFFRHNLASMVFYINSKKFYSYCLSIYIEKILQYRSCKGMKRKWDKYWKKNSSSGIFYLS